MLQDITRAAKWDKHFLELEQFFFFQKNKKIKMNRDRHEFSTETY